MPERPCTVLGSLFPSVEFRIVTENAPRVAQTNRITKNGVYWTVWISKTFDSEQLYPLETNSFV